MELSSFSSTHSPASPLPPCQASRTISLLFIKSSFFLIVTPNKTLIKDVLRRRKILLVWSPSSLLSRSSTSSPCKRWRWWSVTKYWWSENANRPSSWFVLPGDKTVKWWKITALGQFCFHQHASWIVIWFPWKGSPIHSYSQYKTVFCLQKTLKVCLF